jgi:hypothetical protein
MPIAIPSSALDMSLRDVIALHSHAAPRGEGVELDLVHAAVDALAKRLERQRAAIETEQREWLAQQFERIAIAPPAPTDRQAHDGGAR